MFATLLVTHALAASPACGDAVEERIRFAYNDGGLHLTALHGPVHFTAGRRTGDSTAITPMVGFHVLHEVDPDVLPGVEAHPTWVEVPCDPSSSAAILDTDGDGMPTLRDGITLGGGSARPSPSTPVLGRLQDTSELGAGCTCDVAGTPLVFFTTEDTTRLHVDGHDVELESVLRRSQEDGVRVDVYEGGGLEVRMRWRPLPPPDGAEQTYSTYETSWEVLREGGPSLKTKGDCICGC